MTRSNSTTAFYQEIMIEDEDGSELCDRGLSAVSRLQASSYAADARERASLEEQRAGFSIYHHKGLFGIKLPKQDLILGVEGVICPLDFLRVVMKALEATDDLGIADSEIEIWFEIGEASTATGKIRKSSRVFWTDVRNSAEVFSDKMTE